MEYCSNIMKKSVCKLCLNVKELCRESHIIPKFLYRYISGENSSLIYMDKIHSKIKYNSEYEGNILCEDCESFIIGKLDTYASKYLYSKSSNNQSTQQTERKDDRDIVIKKNDPNYDYRRFKLFWLSVLWRASISSRLFFSRIKLPTAVEEDLRKRILSGNPGTSDEYPIFINLPPLINMPDGNKGFITAHMPTMSPVYVENGEYKMCEFIIQGMHYYYIIARPSNIKVEPSVTEDTLTVAFRTVEEQNELIQNIFEMMKGHSKYD